ncbi:MAG: D-alanyl-D-alanine carboxypeptidase [Mogibacterium sp.]|nr:D-alanyl-D-alanine carboxypeptidase [Mogibacterium sp.]
MKKKYISRILTIFLVLSVTLSLVMPAADMSAYAASGSAEAAPATDVPAAPAASAKAVTTITGYPTVLNAARSKAAVISATITPANGGRLVKLQRFNHATGKWYTKMREYVDGPQNATVSFSIPKGNRQRTTSVWRIYVNETETAAAAASENITLTSRNIKSYNLSAKAACIYRVDGNGTGTLVYSKYANTKRAQASTTKLMTAVLLMESGKIKTKTTISKHAASTPWGSGRLSAGDIYKTKDLLYAMMLPSANDAATAVAEKVGGSEDAFVALMNTKAQLMGMQSTHFCNPHGLDANGHYTTATELAALTAYAYTFPEIRKCWVTKTKTIKNLKTKKKWVLWSTDSLIGYISNFLGGKTGTEDNAGCCFTGVYEFNGSTYVTVVLGSRNGITRWADTKKLHSYISTYAATQY